MKALITCGEGGLGRAMRARLEREGYEVESLDLVNGFDVTDPAAWERVEAVDLAVLNAGILTAEIDLTKLTTEDYRRAVSVNVDGVVFGVRRLARVMDRQREIQRARNEALLGQTFEVLVDGASRRPGQWSGRCSSNRILNFTSPQPELLGEYVQVRVFSASPNCLIGEQVI